MSLMLRAITRGGYRIPSDVSSGAHDLISKMLTIDYRKRYSLADIKAHPWMQDAKAPHVHGASHLSHLAADAKIAEAQAP